MTIKPLPLVLGLLFSLAAGISSAQSLPVAVPENISAYPGQSSQLSAPGVLANDIYTAPVTVVLVTAPTHGEMILYNDGSFTYNPNTSFIGEDSFKYQLKDGSGHFSDVATDTIAVGAIDNLNFDNNSVTGGTSLNGYVDLNYNTVANTVVSLQSSNPAVAKVPVSASVTLGNSSATFPIVTKAVAADAAVTISATLYGFTYSSILYINASAPSSLSITGSQTGGDGQGLTGTLGLSGNAPSGGLVVGLESSYPAAASVPKTVTVPAGQSQVSFPITTAEVPDYFYVDITATAAGISVDSQFQIDPYELQLTVSGSSELFTDPRVATPAIIGCTDPAGLYNTVLVTLSLSSTAPKGGLPVTFVKQCIVPGLSAPTSLVVPAGEREIAFKVALSGYATAQETLSLYAYCYSQSSSAALNVYPPLLAMSLDEDDYEYGGDSFPLYLSLEGFAPPGGAAVSLKSTSSSVPVPESVLIPAGSRFAQLTVKPAAVASFQGVELTGSYDGYSWNTLFDLLTTQVEELSLNSYDVKGGAQVAGTIYLTAPAPAGGVLVHLVSSPAGLLGPATVTVTAGKSSVSFILTTKAVKKNTNVIIDAYTWDVLGFGDSESIELTP